MQQQPWHRKTFPSSEAEPPSHRASGSTANLQATHPPVTSQLLPFVLLISKKYPAKKRENLKSTFQPRKVWSALSRSDCKKGENKETKIIPLLYNSIWLLLLTTVNQQISDRLAPNQSCLQNIFIQHGPMHHKPAAPVLLWPGELAASHLSSSCLPPPAHRHSWSSSATHSWQHQALRTLNHDNHLPPGVFEAELGQILSWAVNKE